MVIACFCHTMRWFYVVFVQIHVSVVTSDIVRHIMTNSIFRNNNIYQRDNGSPVDAIYSHIQKAFGKI